MGQKNGKPEQHSLLIKIYISTDVKQDEFSNGLETVCKPLNTFIEINCGFMVDKLAIKMKEAKYTRRLGKTGKLQSVLRNI